MKNNTIVAVFPLFFAVFVSVGSFFAPLEAQALSFEEVLDPLCIFRDCDDPEVINNVNSNNINSNVNSPGGIVTGNNAVVTNPDYTSNNSGSNVNSDIDYGSLGVSCHSPYGSAYVGQRVVWNASAWGGNGNYSYTWGGTEGLSGNGNSASIRYDREGIKSAWVRVLSGGRTITHNCASTLNVHASSGYNDYDDYYDDDDNDNDNDLDVTCSVDDRTVRVGESVRYEADADGGRGSYRYEWEGPFGFDDSGRTTRIEYDYPGTYRMRVEVRSGGDYESVSCPAVRVTDDSNYTQTYYRPSQTVAYNQELSLTCSADRSKVAIGTPVTWTAYAQGGNGVYGYSWSGTDGIQSSRDSVVTGYSSTGTKSAQVTAYSAGQQVTASCGSVSVSGTTWSNTKSKDGGGDTQKIEKEDDGTFTGALSALGAASILSVKHAPWGVVSFLVILILLGTIFYMIYNKNKI